MIIDTRKFDLACAEVCLSACSVLRNAGVSTCVLPSIKKGKHLRPCTVGKIAKSLGYKPVDLIKEDNDEQSGKGIAVH